MQSVSTGFTQTVVLDVAALCSFFVPLPFSDLLSAGCITSPRERSTTSYAGTAVHHADAVGSARGGHTRATESLALRLERLAMAGRGGCAAVQRIDDPSSATSGPDPGCRESTFDPSRHLLLKLQPKVDNLQRADGDELDRSSARDQALRACWRWRTDESAFDTSATLRLKRSKMEGRFKS